MRHAAHEAARNFLDGFAEDIVNTNDADFENRLEEWTAQGFPELAFYRGARPRGRGEIIAEIRKAQRALDGDERALAQATRDELPVLAGALRVAARTVMDAPEGQVVNVANTDHGLPPPTYRIPPVLPRLSSDEPPTGKSLLPARPRPKPPVARSLLPAMPRPKPPIPGLDQADPAERAPQSEEAGLANLLGRLWQSGEEAATQTADALAELWESGKATAGEILGGFETSSAPELDQRPERAGPAIKSFPLPRPEPGPPLILNPTGGQRRDDTPGGLGHWDASRVDKKKDGATVIRKHRATDLESTPGQFVASPITGRITRIGYAYGKDEESKLNPDEPIYRSIHIEGTGKYKGLRTKLLYVDGSMVKVGDVVSAGSALGRSQDIRKRYGPGMTPHTHMQAYWHGERIDPETIIKEWEYDGL